MERDSGRDRDRDRDRGWKSYTNRDYDRKRHQTRDYGGNDDRDRRHKGKEKADDYQQHRKRSRDREDRHRRSTDSPSPRRKERKSGFHQTPVVPPPPYHNLQVCVCGLPPTATVKSIENPFMNAMAMAVTEGESKSFHGSGKVVKHVEIDPGKKFALVKMRSEEEASNALALDGIKFEGVPLQILRPRHYNPILTSRLDASEPIPNLNLGAVNPVGLHDAEAGYEYQIIVGGLPCHLDEEAVRKLLVNHGGQIQELSIEKDTTTGDLNVKCLYIEQSVADDACRSLNGFRFGDKTITAQRVLPNFEP